MKRLLLATSAVFLVTIMIYAASCGEVDPALAPVGASITMVGPDSITWSYNCVEGYNVPSSCYDAFRDYCVASCALALKKGLLGGETQQLYDQCVGTEDVCAEYVCDDLGKWMPYCEDGENGDRARNYIWSKEGRCGYRSFIKSAIVYGQEQNIASEGTDAVSNPLNDVEVVWIASDGEMYELDDVPGEIAPLSNPHYDRTNDRGIAEMKYRVPLPNICGSSIDYELTASIGVAYAETKISFSVTEALEEEEISDDDTGG